MSRKTAYKATVEYLQILDHEGVLDEKLAKDTLTDEQALEMYEWMVIARQFDEVAFKLQRSGRMGTYPQNKGQEAAAIGSAFAAIKGTDFLVPSYRENTALWIHGLPMHYVYLHWMGDERGNKIPEGVNVLPLSVPIGTQMLHATGIAWAYKLRGERQCVITYFGDGATSEGDFHEAMNFAGTFQVPCVFFCQNNQWAISVPRTVQTKAETIAQKGIAYGIPCVQVDGNDLFAVYKATREALDRAREGGGPTIIEAVTYRLGDHTTADDARRYRDADELERAKERDPLIRTRLYLEKKGLWDEHRQKALQEKAEAIVAEETKAAESIAEPETQDMFNDMFAELPDELVRQRDTLRTSSIGQNPAQIGLAPAGGNDNAGGATWQA